MLSCREISSQPRWNRSLRLAERCPKPRSQVSATHLQLRTLADFFGVASALLRLTLLASSESLTTGSDWTLGLKLTSILLCAISFERDSNRVGGAGAAAADSAGDALARAVRRILLCQSRLECAQTLYGRGEEISCCHKIMVVVVVVVVVMMIIIMIMSMSLSF